jgi:hypothetical protein
MRQRICEHLTPGACRQRITNNGDANGRGSPAELGSASKPRQIPTLAPTGRTEPGIDPRQPPNPAPRQETDEASARRLNRILWLCLIAILVISALTASLLIVDVMEHRGGEPVGEGSNWAPAAAGSVFTVRNEFGCNQRSRLQGEKQQRKSEEI